MKRVRKTPSSSRKTSRRRTSITPHIHTIPVQLIATNVIKSNNIPINAAQSTPRRQYVIHHRHSNDTSPSVMTRRTYALNPSRSSDVSSITIMKTPGDDLQKRSSHTSSGSRHTESTDQHNNQVYRLSRGKQPTSSLPIRQQLSSMPHRPQTITKSSTVPRRNPPANLQIQAHSQPARAFCAAVLDEDTRALIPPLPEKPSVVSPFISDGEQFEISDIELAELGPQYPTVEPHSYVGRTIQLRKQLPSFSELLESQTVKIPPPQSVEVQRKIRFTPLPVIIGDPQVVDDFQKIRTKSVHLITEANNDTLQIDIFSGYQDNKAPPPSSALHQVSNHQRLLSSYKDTSSLLEALLFHSNLVPPDLYSANYQLDFAHLQQHWTSSLFQHIHAPTTDSSDQNPTIKETISLSHSQLLSQPIMERYDAKILQLSGHVSSYNVLCPVSKTVVPTSQTLSQLLRITPNTILLMGELNGYDAVMLFKSPVVLHCMSNTNRFNAALEQLTKNLNPLLFQSQFLGAIYLKTGRTMELTKDRRLETGIQSLMVNVVLPSVGVLNRIALPNIHLQYHLAVNPAISGEKPQVIDRLTAAKRLMQSALPEDDNSFSTNGTSKQAHKHILIRDYYCTLYNNTNIHTLYRYAWTPTKLIRPNEPQHHDLVTTSHSRFHGETILFEFSCEQLQLLARDPVFRAAVLYHTFLPTSDDARSSFDANDNEARRRLEDEYNVGDDDDNDDYDDGNTTDNEFKRELIRSSIALEKGIKDLSNRAISSNEIGTYLADGRKGFNFHDVNINLRQYSRRYLISSNSLDDDDYNTSDSENNNRQRKPLTQDGFTWFNFKWPFSSNNSQRHRFYNEDDNVQDDPTQDLSIIDALDKGGKQYAKKNRLRRFVPVTIAKLPPQAMLGPSKHVNAPFLSIAYNIAWSSIPPVLFPCLSPLSDDLTTLLHIGMEQTTVHPEAESVILNLQKHGHDLRIISLVTRLESKDTFDQSQQHPTMQKPSVYQRTEKTIRVTTWFSHESPLTHQFIPLITMHNTYRVMDASPPPVYTQEIPPVVKARARRNGDIYTDKDDDAHDDDDDDHGQSTQQQLFKATRSLKLPTAHLQRSTLPYIGSPYPYIDDPAYNSLPQLRVPHPIRTVREIRDQINLVYRSSPTTIEPLSDFLRQKMTSAILAYNSHQQLIKNSTVIPLPPRALTSSMTSSLAQRRITFPSFVLTLPISAKSFALASADYNAIHTSFPLAQLSPLTSRLLSHMLPAQVDPKQLTPHFFSDNEEFHDVGGVTPSDNESEQAPLGEGSDYDDVDRIMNKTVSGRGPSLYNDDDDGDHTDGTQSYSETASSAYFNHQYEQYKRQMQELDPNNVQTESLSTPSLTVPSVPVHGAMLQASLTSYLHEYISSNQELLHVYVAAKNPLKISPEHLSIEQDSIQDVSINFLRAVNGGMELLVDIRPGEILKKNYHTDAQQNDLSRRGRSTALTDVNTPHPNAKGISPHGQAPRSDENQSSSAQLNVIRHGDYLLATFYFTVSGTGMLFVPTPSNNHILDQLHYHHQFNTHEGDMAEGSYAPVSSQYGTQYHSVIGQKHFHSFLNPYVPQNANGTSPSRPEINKTSLLVAKGKFCVAIRLKQRNPIDYVLESLKLTQTALIYAGKEKQKQELLTYSEDKNISQTSTDPNENPTLARNHLADNPLIDSHSALIFSGQGGAASSSPGLWKSLFPFARRQEKTTITTPTASKPRVSPSTSTGKTLISQFAIPSDQVLSDNNQLLSTHMYLEAMNHFSTSYNIDLHDIVTNNPSFVKINISSPRVRQLWAQLLFASIGIDLTQLQQYFTYHLRTQFHLRQAADATTPTKQTKQEKPTPSGKGKNAQAPTKPIPPVNPKPELLFKSTYLQLSPDIVQHLYDIIRDAPHLNVHSIASRHTKYMLYQLLDDSVKEMVLFGPGSYALGPDELENHEFMDAHASRIRETTLIDHTQPNVPGKPLRMVKFYDNNIGVLSLTQFQQLSVFIHELASYVHLQEAKLNITNQKDWIHQMDLLAQTSLEVQSVESTYTDLSLPTLAKQVPLATLFARMNDSILEDGHFCIYAGHSLGDFTAVASLTTDFNQVYLKHCQEPHHHHRETSTPSTAVSPRRSNDQTAHQNKPWANVPFDEWLDLIWLRGWLMSTNTVRDDTNKSDYRMVATFPQTMKAFSYPVAALTSSAPTRFDMYSQDQYLAEWWKISPLEYVDLRRQQTAIEKKQQQQQGITPTPSPKKHQFDDYYAETLDFICLRIKTGFIGALRHQLSSMGYTKLNYTHMYRSLSLSIANCNVIGEQYTVTGNSALIDIYRQVLLNLDKLYQEKLDSQRKFHQNEVGQRLLVEDPESFKEDMIETLDVNHLIDYTFPFQEVMAFIDYVITNNITKYITLTADRYEELLTHGVKPSVHDVVATDVRIRPSKMIIPLQGIDTPFHSTVLGHHMFYLSDQGKTMQQQSLLDYLPYYNATAPAVLSNKVDIMLRKAENLAAMKIHESDMSSRSPLGHLSTLGQSGEYLSVLSDLHFRYVSNLGLSVFNRQYHNDSIRGLAKRLGQQLSTPVKWNHIQKSIFNNFTRDNMNYHPSSDDTTSESSSNAGEGGHNEHHEQHEDHQIRSNPHSLQASVIEFGPEPVLTKMNEKLLQKLQTSFGDDYLASQYNLHIYDPRHEDIIFPFTPNTKHYQMQSKFWRDIVPRH